ncbi:MULTISPECIES: glutathione synthase [Chryseobacterium]|uniref:glutathione synthase n=1 Tax=Chryseobacterium TaxID=59732 RepID=UPI00129775C4|nr:MULTISPECIES: glutathione synthase [Chryseobacterium]MDR6921821.1 NCAIR mutase (PurE)-related protein [Chryseobacterium sp. 2987]
MAHRNFKKEDFEKDQNEYQLEFKIDEIGKGLDLIVERKNRQGEYEVIQAEIKRLNDLIFICWSEPFDGRVIYNE